MPLISDSIGRVLGKRYRLVSALGTGASAHVFLAQDVTLQRPVAVKVLQPALARDEAFLKRFGAEARSAASLNHPHVLRVFDWGEDGDGPYLVLEYLAGGSLRDLLDRGNRLSPAQAARLGADVGSGLAYAHARGLVHRDVKPANLLFDEEGRVRVADFGVARALAESAWTEPAGAMVGTARYASPEQAEGRPVDGRADVYGLALVLYEAVTGVVPFVSDTTVATLMARVGATIPLRPELGPVGDVLVAATAPRLEDRLDAQDLVAELQSVASRLPAPEPLSVAAPGTPPGGVAEPPGSSTMGMVPGRGGAAGGIAAGAAAGVAGAVAGAGMAGAGDAAPLDATQRVTAAGAGAGHDPVGGPAGGDPATQQVEAVTRSMEPTTGQVPPVTRAQPSVGAGRPTDAAGLTGVVPGQPHVYRVFDDLEPGPPPAVPGGPSGPPPVVHRRRRRKWPWAVGVLVLAVIVAAGLLVAAKEKVFTPSHPVPSLAGMTLAQAKAAVAKKHFHVDKAPAAYSTTVPAGQIVSQQPGAHSSLKEGSTIHVVTSKGPPPVHIPSLSRLTCDAAQRVLAGYHLQGVCPPEAAAYDPSVPEGYVINWSFNGKLDASTGIYGGTVIMAISKGPQPIPIPDDLAGKSFSDAQAELGKLGFTVTESDGPSTDYPSGQVTGTDPPAGQPVVPGSRVTVNVSTGPPSKPLPDVEHRSVDDATNILQQAGFKIGKIYGPDDGQVFTQVPAPGKSVQIGSSVNLYTM